MHHRPWLVAHAGGTGSFTFAAARTHGPAHRSPVPRPSGRDHGGQPVATRVPDSPGSGHSPRWSEGRATSACECGLAGEVGCAGELARDLCTRAATSMSKLGLMSLEVDCATRGAPCTCSPDASCDISSAETFDHERSRALAIFADPGPAPQCVTMWHCGAGPRGGARGRRRERSWSQLISRRVSQNERCVTCFVPPGRTTSLQCISAK